MLFILIVNRNVFAGNVIPASDSKIQYYGRWDLTNPNAPTHSWPGVYIYAEFEGTSIGIMTDDNFSYYNIFIDGTLQPIFHGTQSGVNTYKVASGLTDTHHSILITIRCETNWIKYAFNGFVLDDGKNLLTPAATPQKKIEFIGDSYTVASGNLWTDNNAAPSGDWTDNYEGFGSIVARKYNAQYMISARGGWGMVQDYLGNTGGNIPDNYDRTLVYTSTPKWDFSKWIPNVVVICLGLNDYSGWNGYSIPISQDNSNLYRTKYHQFLSTVMDYYPGAKFVCIAPNDLDWIKTNVSQVVSEEKAKGNKNVFYTYFPYYNGDYVNSGHPDAIADSKIADVIAATIDTINAWTPYVGTVPPQFVSVPNPQTSVLNNYTLNVTTDKYAHVKYSLQNKSYDLMENDFTITGTRNHSTTLSLKPQDKITYYLRAMDAYGNKMDTSAVFTIMMDTTKTLIDWKTTAYDVSGWKKGNGPFGNDQAATIKTQLGATKTAYFRKNFSLTNASNIKDMSLLLTGRTGAIAYINGIEIGRLNVSLTAVPTYDLSILIARVMNSALTFSADNLALLKNGENVLEIEVHSAQLSISLINFDGKLFDGTNNIYIDSGSVWSYYDAGQSPDLQVISKPTDVATNLTLPTEFKLYQNYPNPFNPVTTIKYSVPLGTTSLQHVSLKVYDMLGRIVTTLVNDVKQAGTYEVRFDGSKTASGVYIYQLVSGTKFLSNKLILIK
jgi:hypothetical protein